MKGEDFLREEHCEVYHQAVSYRLAIMSSLKVHFLVNMQRSA